MVANSTIAGNEAGTHGGGVHILADTSDQFDFLNTTVSGNMADDHGGGLYLVNSGGTVALTHLTVTGTTSDVDDNANGDGGGIYSSQDTVDLVNSIVSGNFDASTMVESAGRGTPVVEPDCSGNFASAGVNLIGDDTGCEGELSD